MRNVVHGFLSSATIKTIAGLAGGNLLAMGIGIIGSVVQARFVSPADLGYFRGFSIATGYAFFFHLGFLDALQRSYPFYIGLGERKKALAMAEVCQSWMVAVTVLVSGFFLLLASFAMSQGNWRAGLGWLVQAVAMASFIYGGYLAATYRSGHDFSSVAKGSVFSSIINLFILPFFIVWPYVTMAVRSGLGGLVNLIYLHAKRPLRLTWRFNWREWLGVFRTGFPIFIASYGANTFWAVVETSLVLKYLGVQALGYWSMSFMVLEMANKVPQAMTAVYMPRVTEAYGRTGSVRAALSLCRRPLLWGTVSMVTMAGLASVVLPILIPWLMPKYVGAITTMSMMMIVLVFIILELPYTILVATGKLVQQNISVFIGLTCFVVAALISVKFGMGLRGIVASSLLGRAVKILVTYEFLYLNIRHDSDPMIVRDAAI
jgi:O-antigen/teichoic acid export membrane protein